MTEQPPAAATRTGLAQLVEQLSASLASSMQQQNQSLAELRQLTQAIVQNTAASAGVASAAQAAMTAATGGALQGGAGVSGANVFAAKKVKLELPPLFAGDPAKLSTWIFAVEQYCDLVAINSDHDRVKLAVTHCEKDALTWWRQYCATHPDAINSTDWEDFKIEIEHAFEDVDKELRLCRRLVQLWQTRSVAEYTKQFRNLVIELGSHAPDSGGLLFQYVEGLKENVKMQVLLQRPITLADAESLAERADIALFRSVRNDLGGKRRQHYHAQQPERMQLPGQVYQPRPSGPVPMELGSMNQVGIRTQNGNTNSRRNFGNVGSRSNVICYRCGKPGHVRRNCRVQLPTAPPVGRVTQLEQVNQEGYTQQYPSRPGNPSEPLN